MCAVRERHLTGDTAIAPRAGASIISLEHFARVLRIHFSPFVTVVVATIGWTLPLVICLVRAPITLATPTVTAPLQLQP